MTPTAQARAKEVARQCWNSFYNHNGDLYTIIAAALQATEQRVWDLVEQRMREIGDAYPTDVFIDPPQGQHGETIDACSARMGRHLSLVLLKWAHAARQGEEGG